MACPLTEREKRLLAYIMYALRQSEQKLAASILKRKMYDPATSVRGLSFQDMHLSEEAMPIFIEILSQKLAEEKFVGPEVLPIKLSIYTITIDQLNLLIEEISGFSAK